VDPLRRALKAQEDLAKQTVAERDEARAQRQAQIEALNALQSEKDQLIAKLNSDISETSANFTRQNNELNASLATNRQSLERAQEEVRTIQEASAKTESEMKRELSLRDARIAAQMDRSRMINPPQAPDGEVISSLDSVGLAWINLGRRQQLRPGTVFKIFEKGKSGLVEKATGVVQRVEMDRSELKITEVADRYRPVVKGDVIANEIYSPNASRNIVLMGRFSAPHTKEEVKRLLEELGNKVHDKVSPQVDLVVLGRGEFGEGGEETPMEETEEYKKAINLGIELISISKIRDLLRR
jgi:NAD-dependent DNA ligase